MVTAFPYTSDFRYRAVSSEGYDGVVRISYSGHYATGSLLFGGRAILTAAHLFNDPNGTAQVRFDTAAGIETLDSTKILIHPEHDTQVNNDLALVWLSRAAPMTADRYDIYRAADELGQAVTMVGYGLTGTGSSGAIAESNAAFSRLKAGNRFDAEAANLKSKLGSAMAWAPKAGSQLMADFDDGNSSHDALGQLIGLHDRGLGVMEGLIAGGDSGGPAFIGRQVAGVASYTASLSIGATRPDTDTAFNSSFGEIASWQRTSFYQQWIDQSLRANYPDAPAKAQDLKKEVTEGDSDTSYAYFMVQLSGSRDKAGQILSVDYATRDGTAMAGRDYVAASGRLNLYPGEDQALIPVEIIGDSTPEANENFYLDIFNPIGGNFGPGLIRLTAIRTILDNDSWV